MEDPRLRDLDAGEKVPSERGEDFDRGNYLPSWTFEGNPLIGGRNRATRHEDRRRTSP